jgi:GTPase SAR1 family protein
MPKDPDAIPFFILGNKSDLENERQVSHDLIAEYLR